MVNRYGLKELEYIRADFTSETGAEFGNIILDKQKLLTGNPTLDRKQTYQMTKTRFRTAIPYEFDFAYAVTVHKAQGSEWGKVAVIEEGFPFDREEHSRWLYTACTRAAEQLVWVKNSNF